EAWQAKKVVNAVVGWDRMNYQPMSVGCFLHTSVGSEEFRNFGGSAEFELNKDRICLAWVDHATGRHFNKQALPNLASAYKARSSDETSPIVFAEVLDSLSPHKPLLELQEQGKAAGNELIAAALARVVVLDERV